MSTSGNLQVTGTSNFDSTLIVNDAVKTEDIEVSGNAKIAGDINVNGSLLFSNGKGISLAPSNSSLPDVYSYGKSPSGSSPSINTCLNPNPPYQAHQFGGVFQVYDNGPLGYTGGNILTMQSWNNGSSIDVAGTGGLLVNYFCGKDIYLGTGSGTGGVGGTGGAFVYTGDKVYMRTSTQVGGSTTSYDINTALNVFSNAGNGIKLNTYNNVLPAYSLNNSNFTTYSPFIIYGDGNAQLGQAIQIGMTNSTIKNLGVNLNISSVNSTSAIVVNNGALDVFRVLKNGSTYIGDKAPLATGPHGNAKLAVDGKILAKEIYVNIHNSVWPDYVFEKSYKLLSTTELENYIFKNKHLPGVPSAKNIEETGLNISEMQKIQMEKLEEIFLYVIKQQKEIDDLKKQNEDLKKFINK